MKDIDKIFEDWDESEDDDISVGDLKINDRILVKYRYMNMADVKGKFVKHFKSAMGNEYLVLLYQDDPLPYHLLMKHIKSIDLI